MALLNRSILESMGFASLGRNVQISERASFYNCARISLGDNVRIDDFCVLSAGEGGIAIGNYVHIAVFSSLIGGGKITISDFCNVSSRVAIYSSTDDFSGEWMTNPLVSSDYTNVIQADVYLGRHSVFGTGCVVLPDVVVEEGVAVGALSLVKTNCKAFGVYAGVPARRIAERKRDLLQLEHKFLSGYQLSSR